MITPSVSLTFIYYQQSVLCLVYPMLPVSLDWPFLITPSVSLTFNYYQQSVMCLVYPILPVSLDCTFLITPSVSLTFNYYQQSVMCLVYPMFPVSLNCTFLIASLVFSNVYLLLTICPVSCVPNVASFSGLSILYYPFTIVFTML